MSSSLSLPIVTPFDFNINSSNNEQHRILLSLREDIDPIQLENSLRQLSIPSDAKVELLSSGLGSGVGRKVIAIVGSPSTCNQLLVLVDRMRRQHRMFTVKYSSQPSELEENTTPSVVTGSTDQVQTHLLSQPSSPLLAEQKFITSEIAIPLANVGCIDGWAGRQRLQNYLSHGTIIDVVGRIQEGKDIEPARIFITGQNLTFIQACQASINTILAKAAVPISTRFSLEPSIIQFLLNNRREEMHSILQEYSSSLQVLSNELCLFGIREDALKLAKQRLLKLSFDCHILSIVLSPGEPPFPLEELVRAIQKGGVDLVHRIIPASHGNDNTNPGSMESYPLSFSEIKLTGTAVGIERALMYLPSTLRPHRTKYQQRQTEDIKEFISGKKDGKLIKIMKETGVSISLLPDQLEGLIEICLVGGEARPVIRALSLLTGEFPSETSFFICETHHKRLIGHGGRTIQRVMKKYAVYIKFQSSSEAQESIGMEIAGILPKGLINRLPNVIVRTPAKNGESLQQARLEILEMAEEPDSGRLVEYILILDRNELIRLNYTERASLECFLKSFAESIDLQAPSRTDDIFHGQFQIKICGFTAAITRFKEMIEGKDWKLANLFNRLLITTSRSDETTTSTPSSSTLSHNSRRSLTLTPTITTRHQDSPFINLNNSTGSAIIRYLESIRASPQPSSYMGWDDFSLPSSTTASPLLSPLSTLSQEAFSLALGSPTTTVTTTTHPISSPSDTTESKIFSPIVGNTQSKGPWNYGFPRLPLVDAMILGDYDGKNLEEGNMEDFLTLDWKALTAAHYRRRASAIFNYS